MGEVSSEHKELARAALQPRHSGQRVWGSGPPPGAAPPAPRSCRPDRPPGLHTVRKTSAELLHRQTESRRAQKRHVVSGLTQRRGRLSEPSSGAHRLASIGYAPHCSSQHSVRLSATMARSCPSCSSHAHSRALCARRARPWPPEQPSPSARPARRAPGPAGAAHRARRPPAHVAQPPHRRSEAPHQPPDRRCEEAEWPGRQLGGSAPAYHIHRGAPAPTSRGLAASSQSAQPRAALGGHAGVGGSGGRRGGWLANGLAVGDETRLGEGALSVRSMTTGLGGSS